MTGTERGVAPETDRRGSDIGVTWGDLQSSPLAAARRGVSLRSRGVTNPLRTEVGLREARGIVGERILAEETESFGERDTMHPRSSKGPGSSGRRVK